MLPSNVGAVAVRTEGVSPMMFGGGGKAKPAAKKVPSYVFEPSPKPKSQFEPQSYPYTLH